MSNQRTQLFVRPVSDVRVLDTGFFSGDLGLEVSRQDSGWFQAGDVISVVMDAPLNPAYSGDHEVRGVTSVSGRHFVLTDVPFGQSTSQERGWVTNIVRGSITTDVEVYGAGFTAVNGLYSYAGILPAPGGTSHTWLGPGPTGAYSIYFDNTRWKLYGPTVAPAENEVYDLLMPDSSYGELPFAGSCFLPALSEDPGQGLKDYVQVEGAGSSQFNGGYRYGGTILFGGETHDYWQDVFAGGTSYRIVYFPTVGYVVYDQDNAEVAYAAFGSAPDVPPGEGTVWSSNTGDDPAPTSFFWGDVLGESACTRYAGGVSIRYQPVALDLYENVPFPLTYQVADISNPQARKSDFSKTISLPGTKHNHAVLAQLFDRAIDSTWDINWKKDAFVLQDGLEVFGGVLVPERSKDNTPSTSYDVSLAGKIANLFDSLKNADGGDLKLSDLDLSEWDHPRSVDTIRRSWFGSVIRSGLTHGNYSIGPTQSVTGVTAAAVGGATFRTELGLSGGPTGIAVGDVVLFTASQPGPTSNIEGHHTVTAVGPTSVVVNTFGGGFGPSGATGYLNVWRSNGEGYVYPTVANGITGGSPKQLTDQTVSYWRPAVYAKTVLDACFSEAGFSYRSDFLGTDFFKRLVVPTVGGATGYSYMARNATDILSRSTGSPGSTATNEIRLPDLVQDLNGNYVTDGQGGFYQNGATAQDISFVAEIPSLKASLLSLSNGIQDLAVSFYRSLDSGGATATGWDPGIPVDFFPQQTGNGLNELGDPMRTVLWAGGSYVGDPDLVELIDESNVNGNYYKTYRVQVRSGPITLKPYERVRLTLLGRPTATGTQDNRYDVANPLVYDDRIILANAMPDMTAKDFIVGLILLFNLQFDPDKQDPRNIRIEPFDDYYLIDEPVDWTPKVDVSRTIETTFPKGPSLYRFAYTEDSDLWNKRYKDDNVELYGTAVVRNKGDNRVAEQTTRTTFSPTPIATVSNLYVPTITGQDGTALQRFRTRLLYWTGVRWTPRFTIDDEPMLSNGSAVYGYAGHFDNPTDATLDLDYGLNAGGYYYGSSSNVRVSNDNMFNRFWSVYCDEMTSPDARLVKFWMRLTSQDLYDLRFSRFYFIDGIRYRLQAVKDYDPLTGSPCECEFVKTKASTRFVPTSGGPTTIEPQYPSS